MLITSIICDRLATSPLRPVYSFHPPTPNRPMVAPSSSSQSRAPRNKHPDKFRPQLPIDPFSSSTTSRPSDSSTTSSLNEPWLLKPDSIPLSAVHRRDVVLVLGSKSQACFQIFTYHSFFCQPPAPSKRSVAALLASRYLAHSLVIFASHRPPTLPPSPVPSVRVLVLTSPLAVEDTGAIRLTNSLEWAEQIARVWRASGSDSPRVLFYEEATKDFPRPTPGSLSPIFLSGSVESLGNGSLKPRGFLLPVIGRRRRSSSVSSLSTGSRPPVDPSQRPFDAILNHIPHHITGKHVLKQTILVASITRPFLAPTLSPYHRLSGARGNLKRNLSRCAHSLPPAPPYQSRDLSMSTPSSVIVTPVLSASDLPALPSHMIHITPSMGRISLIRSLDRFLSSFSRQTVSPDEVEHAKQYILSSSTMRKPIVHPYFDPGKCTVLDLVLLGGLDSVSGKSWIGSSKDIHFLPASAPSVPPSPPPVAPKPFRSPSSASSDSDQPVNPGSHRRTRAKPAPRLPPSHGGPPVRPRRSDQIMAEFSRPDSEWGVHALPDLPPHSDPIRRPHAQGPYYGSSLNAWSGSVGQRSRPNLLRKPSDQIDSVSGLPTPPDSDEEARDPTPPPHPTPPPLVYQHLKQRY